MEFNFAGDHNWVLQNANWLIKCAKLPNVWMRKYLIKTELDDSRKRREAKALVNKSKNVSGRSQVTPQN